MENENIQDKWLRREIELNQRHENILAEREELLNKHKIRLLNRENNVKRRTKNLEISRRRNNEMMKEIELFEKDMQNQQKAHVVNSELEILKARYWTMVMRELSTL